MRTVIRRLPRAYARLSAAAAAGFVAAGLVAAALPAPAAAQGDRLARLDPATRAAVSALVDSASAAGLPSEPLIQKALQGAMKNADGARILAAVRGLRSELATARGALGTSSSQAELVAGAGAVHAGISTAHLAQLRALRSGEPLTVPLATLADLVSKGVPADVAADAVLTLARRRASDDEFMALFRDVGRDIEAGTPPADAATSRAKGSSGGSGSVARGNSGQSGNPGSSGGSGGSGGSGKPGKPGGPGGLGTPGGPGGSSGPGGPGASGGRGGRGAPAGVPRQPGKGRGKGPPGGQSSGQSVHPPTE
jgi:hypothetical protein